MRRAEISRKTNETNINLNFTLDGKGRFSGTTGNSFFDHMLNLFATHGSFDLEITAEGDLEVDSHHMVEDTGICLGQAFKQALGDKSGIRRYGFVYLPMDETLVRVCVDISGRPYFVYNARLEGRRTGNFDAELAEEFLKAFVNNSAVTLHIEVLYGHNTHHILEAIYKGLGQVLKMAAGRENYWRGIPSTKGLL